MASYDSIIYSGNDLKSKHVNKVPEYAGQVEITNFRLISPNNFPQYGLGIDIQNMMTKCEITENIFSPYVSGYVDIGDATGLFERMPIIGEEILHISFHSVGASEEDKINRYFRVVKVTNHNKDPKNDRLLTYTLNFSSIEYIVNLATKVQKSYCGMKISDIAKNIYDDYINPHSPLKQMLPMQVPERPELDTEMTKGEHNLIIPNLTPFQAMLFLASRAEVGDMMHMEEDARTRQRTRRSNGAFYCFYETIRDGFKFKSLESLMQNSNKIEYKYAPIGTTYEDVYSQIAEESHLMSEYNRVSAIAVDSNLKNGAYGNRLITHNIIRMRHDYHDLYYRKGYQDAGNIRTDEDTGAIIQILPPTSANDFGNTVDNNSKHQHQIYVIDDDTFHFSINPIISRGSDVIGRPQANVTLKSTNEGCYTRFADINSEGAPQDKHLRETQIENWYSKRKMQNLLLNNFIYQIIVPGNTHRQVGDVITLKLPSQLGTDTTKVHIDDSTLISGKFVVTRISHIFDKNQARIDHSLSIHVMKDSLSRKLPGTDYTPSNFGTEEGRDTEEALAVSGRIKGQAGR